MTKEPRARSLHDSMRASLAKRRSSASLRALTLMPASHIDFSSNDYLSLSSSPCYKRAFERELSQHSSHPIGSRGSRLLDGNSKYAEDLEAEIASFHGAEVGLLFNSGFDANMSFFACLPQRHDVVVYDEFVHASVHAGIRLSRASRTIPFAHNCASALERTLKALSADNKSVAGGDTTVFVAVESLYSMDGDLSPLRAITEVIERLLPHGNGLLVVDEAHSTGIYGEQGRGIVSSLELEKTVFARLHTFGKAMGCNGAIILCDTLTRQYLINYARPLIYSTAMSFLSLAAIKASYSLLKSGMTTPLRNHLQALIAHLYTTLQTFHTSDLLPTASKIFHIPQRQPQSPIFSILSIKARSLSIFCQEGGFVVRPIMSPTVPVGLERIRVCLHASNTILEVERLVMRIREWVELEVKRGEQSIDVRSML